MSVLLNASLSARTDRGGTHRIAVIAGDGVGQEVMPVALDVLRAATEDAPVELVFSELPWNCDYYLSTGSMMPVDGVDALRGFDGIFVGAIGDPARVPDHVSLWGLLLPVRRGLGQYVNFRPARFLPGMRSPLREPADFDFVVVRENSEGEYSSIGGRSHEGDREMAIQVSVFTRYGTERIIRHGFDLARSRRKHLTSATKSNGIAHSMPFWDEIFRSVGENYPDVTAESVHIDALVAKLVRDPASFDVIVASNLFGDLLTDLAAALMGSIGVAPSANINPDGSAPSMFEPVHGSAPDIAGQGVANPIGQVWTGALLLEHLGLTEAAARIMRAVAGVVEVGAVTRDMGGTLSTSETRDELLIRIRAEASVAEPAQ